MVRKTDDNLLALTPLAADVNVTGNTSLVHWGPRQAPSRDEKELIAVGGKQRLAITIIATKARLGASMITEIHQHGSLTFDGTTGFIMEVKDRPGRSQQHQAYINQFSERQIQLLAQQLLATIDIGAAGIGIEIHKSPYPPEPERRPGFLQRLFGG